VTPLNFCLVLVTELSATIGQIFFKHAMAPSGKGMNLRSLAVGIAAMTVSFFVWEALLKKFELSYLFPFDGINRIIVVFGASLFLKEKPTPRIWLGVILISVGVMIVSATEKAPQGTPPAPEIQPAAHQ